jgi:hypothetical protein
VLKVDGYTEFNPDMNVQITRKTASMKKTEEKEKKKCCGSN